MQTFGRERHIHLPGISIKIIFHSFQKTKKSPGAAGGIPALRGFVILLLLRLSHSLCRFVVIVNRADSVSDIGLRQASAFGIEHRSDIAHRRNGRFCDCFSALLHGDAAYSSRHKAVFYSAIRCSLQLSPSWRAQSVISSPANISSAPENRSPVSSTV